MNKLYKRCKFLTNEDVAYIRKRWGITENRTEKQMADDDREIYQMDIAARISMYELWHGSGRKEKISRKKVIELIGREEFISALMRSAFHYNTGRTGKNGEEIYIDSRNVFGKEGDNMWTAYYVDAPLTELLALGFTNEEMKEWGCKAALSA